jgi:hypothetical protein
MENQAIKVKLVVELLGSPKEHVEETMKMVIEKLKKESGVALLKEVTYPAEQNEQVKPMWSTFSDITVEVNSVKKLLDVCFDYMPSSIEVISPENFSVTSNDYGYLMNELLAQLHQFSFLAKQLAAENMYLKQGKEDKK